MNLPNGALKKPIVKIGILAVIFSAASFVYYYRTRPQLPTWLSEERVFYNRVPKCGSRTVLQVLKVLSSEVGFNLVSESRLKQNGRYYFVTRSAREEFINKFENLNTPLVYSRHVNYIDFRRFNRTQPTYINVVRDPIEKLVSHYYFKLYGSQGKPKSTNNTLTLDKCVQSLQSKCLINHINQVPFFCGHDPRCRISGKHSLNRAKKSVEDNFLVVGITEDIKGFFEALSYSMPDFFSKAPRVYHDIEESARSFSKTIKKIPPTNSTVALLKDLLKHEYEFYNFVRKRFYEKLAGLRLNHGFSTPTKAG